MKRACVIGWPIKHSRSPLIHGYWLKQLGLPGEYFKQAVEPAAFPEFVRGLALNGFAGANVTAPHKEMALALADEADAAARAIGAANTLWLDGGHLRATNTDAAGFIAHLDQTAPDWVKPDRPAVVLGAGGAARAIVYALKLRGVSRIRLVNRNLERAEALAAHFGERVEAQGLDRLGSVLLDAGLLVNATTLGMSGSPPLGVDVRALPANATVYEIVYTPLETPLLAAARARGLAAVDGLGMLLHQAVPGFHLWFGVKPAVTPELRALIAADIMGQ